MSTLPLTTTLLLAQIADFRESQAWEEFDRRYRPVLLAFGRSLGLGPDDAADMAQSTLADMARSLRDGQYSREKGRLRSWILGIARHRAARILSARAMGALPVEEPVDLSDERMEALWQRAREKAMVDLALARLRASSRLAPSTLSAFELVALRGVPAAEVAVLCGLGSIDEVYVARSRVTARLRAIVADLEALYDEAG
jgi:RNA polymerase sigma-70 factor (ECF subfamily)